MRLCNRILLFLSFLSVPFAGRFCEGADKVRVLIVTGFDVGAHKWEESAKLNQAILEQSGRFDVAVSSDKEIFASPKLRDYDVLVLNFGFWEEPDPSEAGKAGLLNYVKG